MDFTNHPYRNIDNRASRINKVNQSIIDSYTTKLRNLLRDETAPTYLTNLLLLFVIA